MATAEEVARIRAQAFLDVVRMAWPGSANCGFLGAITSRAALEKFKADCLAAQDVEDEAK